MNYFYDEIYPENLIKDLPKDCIADLTGSGDCTESCKYWVEELDFDFQPKKGVQYLKEFGCWDDDELSDHEENKMRVLWLICGDIADRQN